MAEHTKEAISATNCESGKNTKMLILEDIDKDFAELQFEDQNLLCELIKCNDIEGDICLIIWDPNGTGSLIKSEKLTQADLFLSSMKFCFDEGILWNGPIQTNSWYFKKSGIFMSLIALERKISLILKSADELEASNEETKVHSPLPTPRNYSFKRPKINFTMEDLEHSDLEEADFFLNIPLVEKRIQPKRSCQPKSYLLVEKNEELDDSLDTSDDDSVDSAKSEYQDYQIKEYYDKYGKNPPWQKDRGGKFACPYCNLDCKSSEGLQTHDKFYHQPWPTTSTGSGEKDQFQPKIHKLTYFSTSDEDSESDEENSHNNSNSDSRKTEESERNEET